jgi:DNA mismatch repair protein MLH3
MYSDDGISETLTVRTLPTPIAQRAAGDPTLLICLLRAEMWKVAEGGRGGSSAGAPVHDERQAATPGSRQDWTRRTAGCPAGIVDMLNSRACRSAVMFNDALSREECERLVGRLARCAFPFQCAHGRPSVVPLLRLAEEGPGAGDEAGKVDFVDAFRRWKDQDEAS